MSRFPRRLSAIIPLALFFAAPQHAQAARPMWPVPALSTFDGKKWGDLQLGRTSFREIRDRYETGKGAYESSTELTEPKNSPVRVDLLWVKEGNNEILHAITVRFNGTAPSLPDIAKLYDPDATIGVPYYQQGRFEDWRVLSFPPKGVAAMTLREGDVESAPLVLLTSPPSLDTLSRRLTTDETPVERRIDPHEGEPKRMDFDQIVVDVDLSDNLRLPYGEKQASIEDIENATAGGTIRFRTRGDGTYKMKVTGSDSGKKGGTIYVTVNIEGSGPYGTITAEGTGSDSWSWTSREKDNERWKDSDAMRIKIRDSYRDAVEEARREAENIFNTRMTQSGPPSLWAIRESQWATIVDAARDWSAVFLAPNPILR